MIKIEVTDEVNVKTVIGKHGANAGKQFDIPEQVCYAHVHGEKYPLRLVRSVPINGEPIKAGTYLLDPSSIFVDRFGNLQIKSQFTVRPLTQGVQKAA